MSLFGRPKSRDLIWIVGHTPGRDKRRWTIEGVYSDPQRALAACTTTDHFMGPTPMDKPMPEGPWVGAFYPYGQAADAIGEAVKAALHAVH